MPGHDTVVVGFSAGGVEAMARLVAELPGDLPAAIFVAHHFPATSVSVLPDILRRSGALPALHPVHNQRIEPGWIYVAPPDRHMLAVGNRIHVTRGPRENGHRPAIDPLFRTAATSFGPRVISVLLSGSLDDGTAGMLAVKRHGGITVVQDPDEAIHAGMPISAIESVRVDHILPVKEIAELLTRLIGEPVAPQEGSSTMLPAEQEARDPAEVGTTDIDAGPLPGPPTALTCPECGGALWEVVSGNLVRYRCHVGHAYTADSMVAEQASLVEGALWSALRALEEKAELSRRLAERSRKRGLDRLARRYEAAVENAEFGSDTIRQVVISDSASPVLAEEEGNPENEAEWSARAGGAERT
jgi:two-component system, chemotaxis family, protein-glutamate methylesterase/glutaminase